MDHDTAVAVVLQLWKGAGHKSMHYPLNFCPSLVLVQVINSTYGANASVPVVVQYTGALNKLHSMHISSYMQVLDKQSEE